MFDKMVTPFSSKNDLEMKQEKNVKYPFSGVALNLIDKFLVLGYNQKEIDYAFKNFQKENDSPYNTRYEFFQFKERPSIMNEICNDYTKEFLDDDIISELIFPKIPEMYFLEKSYMNTKREFAEEYLIKNYSIIFSLNP